MDPKTLHERLRGTAELALIDVREEGVFGNGHILRAVNVPLSVLELRFRDLVPRMNTPVVLCDGGADGLAGRAADRLGAMGYDAVTVLAMAGGTGAWVRAGLPLEAGLDRPLSAVEDAYYRPYDRTDGVEEAMNAYLSWEVGLLHQIERDGTLSFPEFPA